MASLLYYRHDLSPMRDEDFDHNCRTLADNWRDLTPLLQWQLESPQAIAATGFQCRITMLCEGGARSWAQRVLRVRVPEVPFAEWAQKFDSTHKVYWIYAGSKG